MKNLIEELPSPLLAQAGESYFAEFSVDGQQLAVAGSDGVYVIDTRTWQTTQHLQQHQGRSPVPHFRRMVSGWLRQEQINDSSSGTRLSGSPAVSSTTLTKHVRPNLSMEISP
ncbi:MAG: hypothetical protein R3C56_19330 [Pirellulaceae bacterium]